MDLPNLSSRFFFVLLETRNILLKELSSNIFFKHWHVSIRESPFRNSSQRGDRVKPTILNFRHGVHYQVWNWRLITDDNLARSTFVLKKTRLCCCFPISFMATVILKQQVVLQEHTWQRQQQRWQTRQTEIAKHACCHEEPVVHDTSSTAHAFPFSFSVSFFLIYTSVVFIWEILFSSRLEPSKMLITFFFICCSLLLIEVSSAPKKCISEGTSCQPIDNDCCPGLMCVSSGDDGSKRCFIVELGVDFVEEEVSPLISLHWQLAWPINCQPRCNDPDKWYYGETEFSSRLIKGCCTSDQTWKDFSPKHCCLVHGSAYFKEVDIPCCRSQEAVSSRNGTRHTCPHASGNPLSSSLSLWRTLS